MRDLRLFKKNLLITQKNLFNVLLLVKLNYELKKAKGTQHNLGNTLIVLFDFVHRYSKNKLIKRKTKVILLLKLTKHIHTVFSQETLKNEFINYLAKQNIKDYSQFFNVSGLFDLKGTLTEENFIILNLAIYLYLIESKFNVKNKLTRTKTTSNKSKYSQDNESMIKGKLGNYGLLNLNDLYMNYQDYYNTIGQTSFTSLVTQLMKDYPHILNTNILHKMADSLNDSFFRFSYSLCLFNSCKYFICDRVICKKEEGDSLNQQ